MLTEEDARKKWCPLSRAENWNDVRSAAVSFTANRLQSGDPIGNCLCIGSRCMAWRWSVTPSGKPDRGRGYCGAFGKDI